MSKYLLGSTHPSILRSILYPEKNNAGRFSTSIIYKQSTSSSRPALSRTVCLKKIIEKLNIFIYRFMNATSGVYIEQMYESWMRDRSSVHKSWDVFFTNVEAGAPPGQAR
jgi:hypothetical protein